MKESAVERYLHKQVEAHGGTTRKFKSPSRRNVPDRIAIWPGPWLNFARQGSRHPPAIHFVECKAPGKRARKGQMREHERLRFFGCAVFVLDTIEKVDSYVEDMRL